MSLRQRLIASGRLRPCRTDEFDRELRDAMIADGRIAVPNNDGEDFVTCYWASMVRWYDKDSRRWESLRRYASGWH